MILMGGGGPTAPAGAPPPAGDPEGWGGKGFKVANTALMGVPLAAAAAAFLASSSFSSGLEGGVMEAVSLLKA